MKSPKTAYDTESVLRTTADKLSGMLDSIETHGDDEHPSIVADVARIATALTTTCAELRQHAKARVREIASIPLDQIIAYLLTLSEAKRQDIAKQILGTDSEEPLL